MNVIILHFKPKQDSKVAVGTAKWTSYSVYSKNYLSVHFEGAFRGDFLCLFAFGMIQSWCSAHQSSHLLGSLIKVPFGTEK